MTALNTLSMSLKVTVSGSGAVNKTGSDYKALTYPLSITKNVGPFSTGNANTASLGANECASFITTIASSGNATINLTSLTDLVDQSGVSLARVKGYILRLLSKTDDSVSGTTCTSVTINGAGTNLATGIPGLAASTTLYNGDFLAWGSPSATGVTVTGTTENIYVLNNDSANSAALQLTIIGATT